MALLNKADWYTPAPFWQNGPAPGAFYHFPGGSTHSNVGGLQRSQAPMTTGTSVVGIQFKDGVLIAADILGSYGSLARFRNLERVMKVNDNIILGAGGDYADYQCLKSNIERKILEEECLDDGLSLKPKALHCWLTQVMYNRRSRFDPFWNNFIIGGLEGDKLFLGTVDKLGTGYSDPVIATGYGAYMATPILRKAYEENKEMTKEQAIELLYKVMQVLFYRDARSFPKYQLGIITREGGVEIQGPLTLDSYWGPAIM
ncbi:proteasome subunit beta type-4 isoform X1 [Bombus pyrosoma]|uniref:proteasome subunit beta type-4 isoform X1 n=2 Tax=Bombus pyrosoma TaxID=396416 RepID=UPI001CB8EDE8|nr:proteasome subunit beta type-4 isoform X1 [Bombus pyrosoma]